MAQGSRISVRIITALCNCLPASLRDEYGAEIVSSFVSAHAAKRVAGRIAAFRFTARSTLDLVVTNVRERRRGHKRKVRAMDTLLQDIRYAFRTLWKRPLFAAVSVSTLAIGIGASTAIFSLVNATLLRTLPFPDPDRLVKVSLSIADEPDVVWSYPKYEVLLSEQRIFSRVAGYSDWDGNVAGVGDPERLRGERVTAQYFDLLGVQARHGRVFTDEEARDPNLANVVVLSDELWRLRFNGDASAIGRTMRLDGIPATIVGVLPSGFRGLSGHADLFVPMATVGPMLTGPFAHFMTVIARLDTGVTLERAQNDIAVIGKRIDELHRSPRDRDAWSANVRGLEELRIDPAIRRSVLVLFAAVMSVLLIVCVNVANLLLARAIGRRREIAVRLALGAGRGRLVRQLMTESLVLAMAGAALGLVLAVGGVRWLAGVSRTAGNVLGRQLTGFESLALGGIELDGAVLVFALVVSVLTGLLFGIAPALQASRSDLTNDLKEGATTGLAFIRLRALTVRNVLVIMQIAVAFVLLAASGLMLRSLARLLDTDTGVDAGNLLTARLTLEESRSTDAALGVWQQLLERTSSLPGVSHAAISDCAPLMGVCNVRPFWTDAERSSPPRPVGVHWVSTDYFAALGVPVLSGRTFDDRDRAGSPNVVVINDVAARHFFPGEDPVGRRIAVAGGFAEGAEIVGVVGNQRFRAIEVPPEPDVYISYAQVPQRSGYLYLRTAADPAALGPAVRREVQSLDPNLPVYDVQTMDQRVGAATTRTRVTGGLLALFAATALILSLVGIYGVIGYAVTQRRREIGVRIALGAQRGGVAALVLRHSAVLAALGLGAGLAGALATTRVLQSLLYEVEPTDPQVLVLVAIAIALAAFAASSIPTVRAIRTDPVAAIKAE